MLVEPYDVRRANAPYHANLFGAMQATLDSGQVILGPKVHAFERAFARYCGVEHCIGLGNGLDALALALRALGIGPGDEVIVPAFTFIATWLAASHIGARPVPVDVREDGLIDPDLIPTAITARTRAIVPVHLFGRIADMKRITAIAQEAGIPIIEDAAQAHGAERDGIRAGSFGAAAAFSFYPTKNLGALGDGGAVCTNDVALDRVIRKLRNYGSEQKYSHELLGQNSRLDELQAAFLLAKLPDLDESNSCRQHVAQRYHQKLGGALSEKIALPSRQDGCVWHQFVLRTTERDQLQALLAEQRVGTAIHYPVAPFDQPCFTNHYDRMAFPVARRLASTVLSLPMGSYLSDEEVDCVVQALLVAENRLVYG